MNSRVDALRMRIRVAMAGLLVEKRRAIERRESALQAALPIDRLRRFSERLSHLQLRLGSGVVRGIEVRASRLTAVEERLRGVSPERVFERGYALVTHNGKTVRDAQQLSPGDELNVRLHVGGVEAHVKKIIKR
jgi:exodeoxyribonuclease VII large subunit